MTKDEFYKIYWKQYCLLEKEFLLTDDYVSIDKVNYHSFSNQYSKLLLTICSEMDSTAELLCKLYTNKVPYGIKNKLETIVDEHPNLQSYRINTKYPYDIKNIAPLVKFKDSISDWWQAYNDIKHRRIERNDAGRYNYTKASLKNVLYALSALYILNIKIYDSLNDDDTNTANTLKSNLFDSDLRL